MKAGEKVTVDHIRRIRPGYGLPPKYYELILNKTVKKDISRGERISWELFSDWFLMFKISVPYIDFFRFFK